MTYQYSDDAKWSGDGVTSHFKRVRFPPSLPLRIIIMSHVILTEKDNVMKPDCYKCKYRRSIPGDAHSSCFNLILLLGKYEGESLGDLQDILNVKGDPHGIKNGWFEWPFNYDPIWLVSCDGFSPSECLV
jgi:hypothetical protein